MSKIIGSIIKKVYELRNLPIEQKRKRSISPYRQQKNTLKKLLKKAQFTAFGEHYRFSEILKEPDFIEAFQKNIPVFDYNKMAKEWWYRALNGESFVSWPGRVKYFALTSGTSESSSKYIPVTAAMLRSIRRASIRQLVSAVKYDFPPEFYTKGMLMIGGSTHLNYNGTYYAGDLSGISASTLPFWFQHFYKPGKRISKESDWETKLKEMVLKAPEWDIGVVVGVPAWVQIIFERIIEHYNLKNIHEIWPNLAVYVHSGVAFGPYEKRFKKLLGKDIIYNESYLASEGYIAVQTRLEGDMEMILDNGIFFEFVPFNSENFDSEGNIKENPQALTIQDVEENVDYALLLSTNAGAWRYLIGDVIRFTDKARSEIIITGRTKHFLSLVGEHLSVDNMTRAIELLERDMNIDVREFTVAGVPYETMFAHRWYIGSDDQFDEKKAAKIIDEHLKVLNDDYRVERLEALKDVSVTRLPVAAFDNWMKMKEKEGGAHKFPRVMKGKMYEEWTEYIQKYLK